MKVVTPEISWHGKDAIFSIDIQPLMKEQLRRIVTAGLDNNVRVRVMSMVMYSSLFLMINKFIVCYFKLDLFVPKYTYF